MTTIAALSSRPPRAPAALRWAIAFDLLHLLAGFGFAGLLASESPHGLSPEQYLPIGFLAGLAVVYGCVLANLRRGRAWAWVAQLVLICLVVALSSIPGLLWVPLLVAWCSPGVRDWFDPPARREF